jgi:hypothetical protein
MTENAFFPPSFVVQYHISFAAQYTHRQVALYKKLIGMVEGIISMLAAVALHLLLFKLFRVSPRPADASE